MSQPALADRVAIVTGASRGIGEQCARVLAEAGAHIVLAARSVADLDKLAGDLGGNATAVACDLTSPDSARALVAAARDQFGRVDVLVNNAGISHTRPVQEFDLEAFQDVVDINLKAVLVLTASTAEVMMATATGGSIINISTVAAGTGTPYMSVYGATKAAVESFTRSAACELGPLGIRVNAVAPGLIETDMWARGRTIPGLVDRLEAAVALRRWGTPGDIADVVGFLASDASRYVTGQTIVVDGGMANMMELLPRRD